MACLVVCRGSAVSGDTGHTHNQDWFLVASFMLLQCCSAAEPRSLQCAVSPPAAAWRRPSGRSAGTWSDSCKSCRVFALLFSECSENYRDISLTLFSVLMDDMLGCV